MLRKKSKIVVQASQAKQKRGMLVRMISVMRDSASTQRCGRASFCASALEARAFSSKTTGMGQQSHCGPCHLLPGQSQQQMPAAKPGRGLNWI